jgi:molybdate transport system substrate-binding protein
MGLTHARCRAWQGRRDPLGAIPAMAARPRQSLLGGTMSAPKRSSCREVRVVCSGAFRAAYQVLVEGFEGTAGCRVVTAWGSSAPGAATSIPARLAAGEPLDLVIMAREGLDRLIGEGLVVAATELARCGIGVAVRTGAPRPDLTSTATLIGALKRAHAIAYSSSASGIYLKGLFQRLGLAETLGSRMKQIQGEPVGAVVARGEAEIGFQQVSELLPVPGIDFVGPLPAEIQHTTAFAAGIPAGAVEEATARALIAHLTAPSATAVIRRSGMEPV